MVVVPVVVRDRAGKSLGNLVQDDFQIFDDNKEQSITSFFIETAPGRAAGSNRSRGAARLTGATADDVPVPPRYIAYLFDDLNLKFPELVAAKEAVFKYVAASLRATDRIGIYSTSGRVMLDFTNDRAALKATLLKLLPRPIPGRMEGLDCIRMSYARAQLIAVQRDEETADSAVAEATACMGADPYLGASQVSEMVLNAARRMIWAAERNATATLAGIRYAIDRAAAAPARPAMIFISPGFVIPDNRYELMTDIDRAIRARIAIGALDARGVRVTGKVSDMSLQVTASLKPDRMDNIVELVDSVQQAATLTELTNGSGGAFVRGTNDLVSALGRLSDPPEHVYVLAFARGDVRADASYHRLTVKLRRARGLNVTARRGYVTPPSQKVGK